MNLEELSYCGLYCGGCKNYKEYANCMGCRNEKEMVDDCPTRKCCIEKEILHCGECNDFPCDMMKEFYNSEGKHKQLAYENIGNINTVGIENWILEQKEKHTCSCGSKIRWFADKCSNEDCEG